MVGGSLFHSSDLNGKFDFIFNWDNFINNFQINQEIVDMMTQM